MASIAPYWQSPLAALYLGDAAMVLQQMPAESVDLCVTSPPFWNLRDYKVKGQIGLELTPELWLEHILAVFQEVRRVLRPWATCWIEIGDSYAGSGSPGGDFRDGKGGDEYLRPYNRTGNGLKPLDLVGIPFRLALALQADGWWLRSVIIWDKPSPMPESVSSWKWVKCRVKVKARGMGTSPRERELGLQDRNGGQATEPAIWADCPGCPKCAPNEGLVLRKGSWRPTEAHSYILMLAKGVPYFADGEAVREAQSELTLSMAKSYDHISAEHIMGPKQVSDGHFRFGHGEYSKTLPFGRNLRSVWRIGPEPSSLPHFATYPIALPERCILAGTSEWGNCPRCGMPWAPVIATKSSTMNIRVRDASKKRLDAKWGGLYEATPEEVAAYGPEEEGAAAIIGWRPTCTCSLTERVPALVLDPFCGTGSTNVAAQQLGRKSIGIDLNPKYLDMAAKRLEGVSLPLAAQERAGPGRYPGRPLVLLGT